MNCAEHEELIALWVEGDLGERQASLVERHLTPCASCRGFADAPRESQAELKELREEEPHPATLAEIRQSVLSRIGAVKPSWLYAWRWQYALATVVIAVAVGVPLLFRSRPAGQALPPARAHSSASVGQAVSPAREVKPRLARSMTPRRRSQANVAGATFEFPRIEPVRIEPVRIDPPIKPDPLVVKLVTDDPDVVIVWLIDRNGDSL